MVLRAGGLTVVAPRAPSDVSYLGWSSREDFGRVRAEWLELIRWDVKILPVAKLVIQEIAAKLGHDRSDAWPSIPYLAAALNVSEPTVKRAIASAIERGVLVCEKRGFGGANHYAMAMSRQVRSEVMTEYERRMTSFEETRRPSMRSPMIPMENDSNEITGDPSMRSPMISHSDHPRSLNEITGDPLSLSSNPITEPYQRSPTDGLGDRVEDRSHGGTDLPSESPSSVLLDDDEADEQLRVEEEALARLGQGDLVIGRRRAALIGPHRLSHLAQRILSVGMIEAAPDIFAAIEMARDLEARATLKAEAVTP